MLLPLQGREGPAGPPLPIFAAFVAPLLGGDFVRQVCLLLLWGGLCGQRPQKPSSRVLVAVGWGPPLTSCCSSNGPLPDGCHPRAPPRPSAAAAHHAAAAGV